MAHRRSPVAAQQRDMQHFRMPLHEPDRGGVVVGANRCHQRLRDRIQGNPLLQLSPMREPVLAGDHQLRVGQTNRPQATRVSSASANLG